MGIEDILRARQTTSYGIYKQHWMIITYNYCRQFSSLSNPTVLKEFRMVINDLSNTLNLSLTEVEKSYLANLMPTSSQEVKAIVKSLERIENESLELLIDKMKETFVKK